MGGSFRKVALVAGAAAGLALPAEASAGQIAVDRPCYAENQPINVTGGGFTPNGAVQLTYADGSYAGQATADAAGNVTAIASAPLVAQSQAPTTLTATDAANPTNTGSVPLQVTKLRVSVQPTRARPHTRVTYRARGFTTGTTLYGHYLYKGRLRKNARVGKLATPCGTITKHMSLLPLKRIRYGVWTVQFDANPHYSRTTVPAIRGALVIYHRLRLR
jgi:hypothetical protein